LQYPVLTIHCWIEKITVSEPPPGEVIIFPRGVQSFTFFCYITSMCRYSTACNIDIATAVDFHSKVPSRKTLVIPWGGPPWWSIYPDAQEQHISFPHYLSVSCSLSIVAIFPPLL
jgi:hypothetical protein